MTTGHPSFTPASPEPFGYAHIKWRDLSWVHLVPYLLMHLSAIAVIWVGASWFAVGMCLAMYVVRMFFITGFMHRYFSHRAFKTSRAFQFIMAVCVGTCAQKGPLWWAAHHRHHHKHSDEPVDTHSPRQHGFFWSHVGWFWTKKNFRTNFKFVGDLNKFPELRWLDKYHLAVPTLYAGAVFAFGHFFGHHFGTNAWQFFVWVFCISTVLVYHGSYTINSLSHKFGNRRYETSDDSKNNFWLALLTLGEGWHNNHHHYPVSAKQGFYWWEVDISYYVLVALSKLRLVWNLRGVPDRVRDHHGIFEAEVLADEELKELELSSGAPR